MGINHLYCALSYVFELIGPPQSPVLKPLEEPEYARVTKRPLIHQAAPHSRASRSPAKPEVLLQYHPNIQMRAKGERQRHVVRVSSGRSSQYDSFRDSNAVDLGADPHRGNPCN